MAEEKSINERKFDMSEEDKQRLADTNMENYGSKEHKDLRRGAAEKEPAWEGIGQSPGIQIWRIEKFEVKSWPKNQYGEFHGGDSYIILHTIRDPTSGKFSYDVFFWLGAHTSQDEAGTAAYKTVELDDYLGDEPVQYREVQGNESKHFLDLFDRLVILEGGVESGFNRVRPEEYKPHLLHVTGYKKHVQVYEVPIKVESLNNHDSFVLDCGVKLFIYNGDKATNWEKHKANQMADQMRTERFGKVREKEMVDGIADDTPAAKAFWEYFGGKPDSIADISEEEKYESTTELTIQKVSDATGEIQVTEMCRGQLDQSVLQSDDAFIIDAGVALYIWIGKNATKNEHKQAMTFAMKYLQQCGRDPKMPMARVVEGKEPAGFKKIFQTDSSGDTVMRLTGGRKTSAASWKEAQ